ncbi:protein apterous isoform X2 [Drosophila eugracilis]|uniref:protein apterous isoform X2 n=1 Tax=Drosophila eugracilis TaxID=29029 RepID=UPI0007E61387|nr:protein apterous isoform X2 [Drosophila eugracilis]
MGVCTEERPVMHWQSARFLGPGAREKSPTPPVAHQGRTQSVSAAGAKNKHPLFRVCSSASCPEICDHSTKSFGSSVFGIESFQSYEAADRSIFEDSTAKFSISRSRTDCTEVSDETTSAISFKTEPFGPASSPESTSDIKVPRSHDDCSGCGQKIQDRFYLSAVEKHWHASCLQCYACRQPLERESTCYSRDGNIYCKNDYYSFFGIRRCTRCLASISSNELVMRSRNLVFHVNCFCCTVCHTPLKQGDQYGIIDSLIYCRTHYSKAREVDGASSTMGATYPYSAQFGSPQNDSSSPHSDPSRSIVPTGIFVPTSHTITGLPQTARQKGRPRKRKVKDIEAFTANIETVKTTMHFGSIADLNTEYVDFGRGSHLSSSSRTKRMRTSFKHHQLRTMKSYFAINHNPDAKDLKQLSQKTGLPKRVLQVWFQNARAKWRRMMLKQDGSGIMEKGDGALDLDSISVHSPTSFLLPGPNSSPPLNLD